MHSLLRSRPMGLLLAGLLLAPAATAQAKTPPELGLAGEWSARLDCGEKNIFDLSLRVFVEGGQILAVAEPYYDDVAELVLRQHLVGRERDNKAIQLVPTDHKVAADAPWENVPSERIQTFNDGMVITFEGDRATAQVHSCTPAKLTRITATHPARRPTIPLPAQEGAFFIASSLEDQCGALLGWAERLKKEYPDANLDDRWETYPKAVALYADDDFVPVFGAPYDQLSIEKFAAAGEALRFTCRRDPFQKVRTDWVWDHPVLHGLMRGGEAQLPKDYYFGRFSPAAITHAIREIRSVRNRLQEASSPTEREAILMEVEASSTPLLWPSELAALREEVARDKASSAREKIAALMDGISAGDEPASALARVRLAKEEVDSEAFANLPPAERAELQRTLEQRRRELVEEVAEPVLAIGRLAPPTIEGAEAIDEVLSSAAIDSLTALTPSEREAAAVRLRRQRDQRIEKAVSRDMEELRSFPKGLAGLEAGADWRTRFDQRYARFADAPAVLHAKEAFVSNRSRRLNEALPEFEQAVKALEGPKAAEQAQALKGRYLSWQGDAGLPESLTYELLASLQ